MQLPKRVDTGKPSALTQRRNLRLKGGPWSDTASCGGRLNAKTFSSASPEAQGIVKDIERIRSSATQESGWIMARLLLKKPRENGRMTPPGRLFSSGPSLDRA